MSGTYLDFISAGDHTGSAKRNFVLFGHSGVGKTTAVSQIQDVAIVLSERHHVSTVKAANPNAFLFPVTNWDELRKVYLTIRDKASEHGIRAVALDSATDVMELAKRHVLAGSKNATPSVSEWGRLIDMSFDLFRAFRDLPISVVYVCLAEETQDSDGDSTRTLVRPSLVGRKSVAKLMGMVHACGYAFKTGAGGTIEYKLCWDRSDDRMIVKTADGLPAIMPLDMNEAILLATAAEREADAAPKKSTKKKKKEKQPSDPNPATDTTAGSGTEIELESE